MIIKPSEEIAEKRRKIREQRERNELAQKPIVTIKNNISCYFDPVRNKYVGCTPEETVRQHLLLELIVGESVSPRLLRVEEHLSHYVKDIEKRADILLLHYKNETAAPTIPLVIECKAPNIPLGHLEEAQVKEYGNLLNSFYLLLTNGDDDKYYARSSIVENFVEVEELPSFQQMICNSIIPLEEKTTENFVSLDTYKSIEESVLHLKNEWFDVIGENTEYEKAVCVLNLHNCLMNTRQTLQNIESNYFQIVQDFRLTHRSYGNAGYGKGAYSGLYRTFEILREGKTEFISIRLWGTGAGHTSLCIGRDNTEEKVSHHALQYNIDKFLQIDKHSCYFYHSGRMSVGKIQELITFSESYAPHLLEKKKFFLGELKNNELFCLSSPNVTELLKSIIEYALLRDTFQKNRKSPKHSL